MESEKISGRIGTRIVGALELVGGICLFGLWIWVMVIQTKKFLHDTLFSVVLILFGVYFMAGIVGGFFLIYATYSHASLKVRKILSIIWAVYRVASFVGAVVLMCATQWFSQIEWFMVMIGLILKWLVFFCVVCTYIWGLSEAIEMRIKTAASMESSMISFNRKVAQAQPKKQWQQVQSTQNYGAFASKKQFC